MALERIEMDGPELPERREPCIDFHQRLRPNAVKPALRIDTRFDETRIAQHAQVLRNRGLGQIQRVLDVAHRLLGRCEQTQNGAAARFGNDGESGFHSLNIRIEVYECQGMYWVTSPIPFLSSRGRLHEPGNEIKHFGPRLAFRGQHVIGERGAGFEAADAHQIGAR